MHKKADEWDKMYKNSLAHNHVLNNNIFVPINRPCDWCGEVMYEGYIHTECREKEDRMIRDSYRC